MIEQLLEGRIMAAVRALDIPGLTVIGAWDTPTEETADTKATCTVVVTPRTYSRFTVCEATFPVWLNLAVSTAVDKDGTLFLRAAGAISEMLHAWNMNRRNEAKSALGVEGKLSVGGIRVDGGEAPYLDREKARRTLSISFQVVGFVAHAANNTTNNED